MPDVTTGKLNEWRTFGMFLPYPDFRESARSMDWRALGTCLETIDKVYEVKAAYRLAWQGPLECQSLERSPYHNLDDNDMILHGPPHAKLGMNMIGQWWGLWQPYPAALALYSYEIAKAYGAWHKGTDYVWQRDRIRAKVLVGKERAQAENVSYTPSLMRKLIKQIPWLGDESAEGHTTSTRSQFASASYQGYAFEASPMHSSHRNYLLQSNRRWYRQYGWKVPNITAWGQKPGGSFHQYLLWFPAESYKFARKELHTYRMRRDTMKEREVEAREALKELKKQEDQGDSS